MKQKAARHLTYEEQRAKCEEFLNNFEDSHADSD
jgi:hypothetical protein